MSEQIVRIKPFEILALIDYQGIQEPNRHGRVVITALISSKRYEEYLALSMNTTWVDIFSVDESGNETILFCGALSRMKIRKELHDCIMELEICTGTVFLESEEHTRSFQAENLTFKNAIDACNSGYNDTAAIITDGKDKNLPHFILQYNADDWTFLRRLCAIYGSVLVPSCTMRGIKYFFGMPELKETAVFDTDCYSVINSGVASIALRSRETYFIGTRADFLGQNLTIWKIESKLENSVLYHTYYLSRDIKNLIKPEGKYNMDMIGASLFGTVTEVKNELVKILIAEDENMAHSGERWFPFSTVYSSPDGAGWYCMPEQGDKIRLYFPAASEKEAYVCSAVHENEGSGVRTNPDHKIWRNRYGKEIRLTPDNILITNNHGNSIELWDDGGVRIQSNGSVSLKAGGRIQIGSENSGIEMTASSRIRIRQGEAELLLQDSVKVTGTKVNIM